MNSALPNTKPVSRDMTVVIVSDFGHVNGGAAQVAIASAAGLARRGLSVKFVYAVGPLDNKLERSGVVAVQLNAQDVWSIQNPLAAAVRGIWNGEAAAELSKVLDGLDRSRTVVHFHQWTKAFSPSAIAACLRLRMPCAISLHDYFFACPNGAYYNFQSAQPCHLRPMSMGCLSSNCDSRSRAHKLVRVMRQAAQNVSLRGHEAEPVFVHPSAFAKNVCAPFLSPVARHCVIPHSISFSTLPRVPAETNREYMFVGRLTPEKGGVSFARAARLAGVPATFIGSGPCEKEIRQVNPDAKLVGWVPADKVSALLRSARALVFPSRWYETFGLVCAEALAQGLPVLASASTGAADLVKDRVNGATFSPEREDRLVDLLRWLEQDEIAKHLSINAYDGARKNLCTIDDHVDALCQLYGSLTDLESVENPLSQRSFKQGKLVE